jgi:hypothetical protein
MSHVTIKRALRGDSLTGVTVTKLARIAPKVRTAESFYGMPDERPARRENSAYVWGLEYIRAARDAQLTGSFSAPVRMAEAMRTDDALFVAYHNRLAPASAIATRLEARGGARGEAVMRRAKSSVFVSPTTLVGLVGTMVNHGIAIGYNTHEAIEDGTQVDFKHREWPLEHVTWDSSREVLTTATRDGTRVDIVHGDGFWTVYRKFDDRPWAQEACILPAALLWAAHAMGISDWAGASKSHGLARVTGMLPDGVDLADENGALPPTALAFLNMLRDVVSGEAAAAIMPFGSSANFLANGSTAWQVFSELLLNREKAGSRIYNGTDATLGSVGGAPGVDIATLFGVASTKVQGDFAAIESGLDVGVYQPWTAINCGDSRYAPRLAFQMPDPDENAKHAEKATRRMRLFDAIKRMREEKLAVTQEVVDLLSSEHGVTPAPQLAAENAVTSTILLAPTDVAKVVRVREARNAQGLEPFGDYRDDLTISELEVDAQAKADARLKETPEAAAVPAANPAA